MVSSEEWQVSCRDVAGKRRTMAVYVKQGNVVVVAPPGETAVLAPLEAGRLRAAIREAVVTAAAPEQSISDQ